MGSSEVMPLSGYCINLSTWIIWVLEEMRPLEGEVTFVSLGKKWEKNFEFSLDGRKGKDILVLVLSK